MSVLLQKSEEGLEELVGGQAGIGGDLRAGVGGQSWIEDELERATNAVSDTRIAAQHASC
jgi:hypothetical protein